MQTVEVVNVSTPQFPAQRLLEGIQRPAGAQPIHTCRRMFVQPALPVVKAF